MDLKTFNREEYNRKKTIHRIKLGIEQMKYHPLINLIWVILMAFTYVLKRYTKMLITLVDENSPTYNIYRCCLLLVALVMLVLVWLGINSAIGQIIAIRDEAIVFSKLVDEYNDEKIAPILTHKRVYVRGDGKTKIIEREFYSPNISFETWIKREKQVLDKLEERLIGEMSQGKASDKGNYVYFKSIKGIKPENKGILYDKEF